MIWVGAGLAAAVVVVALIVGSLYQAPPATVAQADKSPPAPTKVVETNTNPAPEVPVPAGDVTAAPVPAAAAPVAPPPTEPAATAQATPTAPPVVEQTPAPRAEAVPSATDKHARAAAAPPMSRKQRLAQQRSEQRKAEEARLIEQHAAELRAAQLQEQDARVQELLAQAKGEYAAGHLWEPAGANAADHYRQILEMQPQRAEALAGAQRVANLLALEAAQTEAVGDVYTTKILLDRIQTLQPDHPKLAGLQQTLDQMLSAPATLSDHQRGRLEQAAKYMARANTDLGRDPVDSRALEDATSQYDKAVSSASTAPGLPSLQERLVAAYSIVIKAQLTQDPNRARKLLNAAHKHHWSSPDLDQLEASLAAGGAPTTPLKEAQAQAQ